MHIDTSDRSGGVEMEKETWYLMQSMSEAWERGAVIYKDGKEIYGVPEFSVLMEDSSYMIDLEDNGSGRIVRINFQKLNKDIM